MKRKLKIIIIMIVMIFTIPLVIMANNSKVEPKEESPVSNEELLSSEETPEKISEETTEKITEERVKEIMAEITEVSRENMTIKDITVGESSAEETSSEAEIFGIEEVAAGTIISESQLENLDIERLFYQQKISDSLFQRIYGKSFKENCSIPREELVYIRVLYYGFDKETHVGELITNKKISQDLIDIFTQLYIHKYQIEKMVLVDDYDADDERSMSDNNTSSFNFRQISGSASLSKHSMGYAIDINPLYNPYIRTVNGEEVCEPGNSAEYVDRTNDFPHKIDKNDLCYQLFNQFGYTWGGDWNSVKDYQHFEKVIE